MVLRTLPDAEREAKRQSEMYVLGPCEARPFDWDREVLADRDAARAASSWPRYYARPLSVQRKYWVFEGPDDQGTHYPLIGVPETSDRTVKWLLRSGYVRITGRVNISAMANGPALPAAMVLRTLPEAEREVQP